MRKIITTILFFVISIGSVNAQSIQESLNTINSILKRDNPSDYGPMELKSDGFLYCYFSTDKQTWQRIHVEDISHTDMIPVSMNLTLNIYCEDNKNCSYWNLDYTDTAMTFLTLLIRDSRSGDKITDALYNIVYKFSGKRIGDTNKLENSTNSRKVYFCKSESAYAYHSNMSCDGLQNCSHNIYSVSESSARQRGYRYCTLCWE